MEQAEVERRIEGLDDAQANAVVCALTRHSRVQDMWFGYWSCARCGADVGDSLAGAYEGEHAVMLGHHCDTCRANVHQLDWIDLFRLKPEHLAYLDALKDVEGSKAEQARLIKQRDDFLAESRAKYGAL